MAQGEHLPATRVLVACCIATESLLIAEDFGPLVPDWPIIDADAAVALDIRAMLARRKRWAAGFDQMLGVFERPLSAAFLRLFGELPDACFDEWDDQATPFSVPLIDLLDDPATAIGLLMLAPYDDDTLRLDVFRRLRKTIERNSLAASGFPADADPNAYSDRIIGPHEQRGKSPRQLLDLYLTDTPFHRLLTLPVPFHVPTAARFEHCHVVGGTGHGKTQLLQRMIHADLVAATQERRSVVVVDSQGDLIDKLLRLDLFSPDRSDGLADRLVLIDPADVEHPPALNLFDASEGRLAGYRPSDRERIENGAIEVYETLFADLLGAELTQKQGVVFKYLARLMVSIPGATIHTLIDLMEDGRPYRDHMERLRGAAARFFATEFFHPSFAATKKQIARRLWGVLATPAFERILAQPEGKIDLFEALDRGSIILVSTAKEVLKDEGSALFGRFIIKLVAQAALERAVQAEAKRTPTFLYVDEAQEYVDPSIEALLTQARKYRVGLTIAHQSLDQLSVRERASLLTNASLKCAGGVSAKDARALAEEMRTDASFIEGMRKRRDHSEFAIWLKHHTPRAVQLTVPFGFLERQPTIDSDGLDLLIALNRARYCGRPVEAPASPSVLWESEHDDPSPLRPAAAAPAEDPVVHIQAPRDSLPALRVRRARAGRSIATSRTWSSRSPTSTGFVRQSRRRFPAAAKPTCCFNTAAGRSPSRCP